MSELYFNELSVKTEAENTGHANFLLQNLFDICDAINNLKFDPLKLKTQKDFASRTILTDNYTFFTFLESLKRDVRQRYITYLAQSPHLHENPYFRLDKVEVVGFGHAFLNDGVSVSINNNDNWGQTSYSIQSEYLGEENDAEIEYDEKEVKHLPGKEKLAIYKDHFYKRALQNAVVNLENVDSIEDFWNKREKLFPNLEFSPQSEGLLHKFGALSHPSFIRAVECLNILNLHLKEVDLGTKKFEDFPIKITPDTPSTLGKYGSERTFTLPSSGEDKIFSLHAKLGELRIYIYPNADKTKLIIGHIGGHLTTKKYKKA
ncbi:hypothetical protein I6I99_11065 [Sphingobacterium multivorum]|nr:hypothetical protein [Sphingobacterium multivorum]QQT33067.1 hypothetical protein I6I99_11065 [Sphingobacterium multivorum]